MFVLAVGDAFDGMVLFVKNQKPFKNEEEAIIFGDENFEHYKVIEIHSSDTLEENDAFEENEFLNKPLSLCFYEE